MTGARAGVTRDRDTMYHSISLSLLPVPSNFGASLSLCNGYRLGVGGTIVSSLDSETSGVSITVCTISGDPSRLSRVLGVTEPDAVVFCRPSSSEEFLPERNPVLVGYGLVNGNLVRPVRLMMY